MRIAVAELDQFPANSGDGRVVAAGIADEAGAHAQERGMEQQQLPIELLARSEVSGQFRLTWTIEDLERYTVFVTVAPVVDSAGRLGRVKGSLRRSAVSDRVGPLTRPAP